MRFLKVPRSAGEKIRRELLAGGFFAVNYPILNEEGFLLFPLCEGAQYKNFEIVYRDCLILPSKPSNLKAELKDILTDLESELLVGSFDIIGEIAIIEIPKELQSKETLIGQAVLRTNPNIKTVLKKQGAMEGEYRLRPLKYVAGINKSETIYRENGVSMKLDVSKVYFSVRLSNERKRISELVKDDDHVLVLFAGIGPFALVIAKNHPDTKIVAVELNPEAVKYMEESIKLNKFKNIIPEQGDAREVVNTKYKNFADRIIMPLPKSAHQFLDVAFNAAKNGAIIHFYSITDSLGAFDKVIDLVEAQAKKSKISVLCIAKRIVRPYSPTQVQVAMDFKVKK